MSLITLTYSQKDVQATIIPCCLKFCPRLDLPFDVRSPCFAVYFVVESWLDYLENKFIWLIDQCIVSIVGLMLYLELHY